MPTRPLSTRDRELAAGSSLAGRRVLIVESENLVALDLRMTLTNAGCIVVGPCSTATRARRLMGDGAIDGALIDRTVGCAGLDPVADTLAAKGIPFVIFTSRTIDSLPERHRHRPLTGKPFVRDDLLAALERAMNPRPPLHIV